MAEVAQPSQATEEAPYWSIRPGIAAIKTEYVLWDTLRNGGVEMRANDDDAAEGRTSGGGSRPQRGSDVEAKVVSETKTAAEAGGEGEVGSSEKPEGTGDGDGEPPVKKVRLSGAQKKAAAKERNELAWQAKKAEKAAAKKEAGENGGDGGKIKLKGQNKGRKFDHQAGVDIKLCTSTSKGRPCPRLEESGPGCKFSHDLVAYLAARPEDVPITYPSSTSPEDLISTTRICPQFTLTGECSYGYKCRFLETHLKKLGEGEGFQGCSRELVADEERKKNWEKDRAAGGWSEKGEKNLITVDKIRELRGVGLEKENRYPLTTEYLTSIGEPLDVREAADQNRKGGKRGRGNGGEKTRDAEAAEVEVTPTVDADEPMAASTSDNPPEASTSADQPSVPTSIPTADPDARPEVDLSCVRLAEKRRLDFKGKLYLAPLTTVGNLPFRRLCGDFGNDISCSEMGLAQEFMNGNTNEWSLVRRHPSEKLFGIQVCGSRPQTLVPTAEIIAKSCDIDFLDVNCGCPIDLVFNKGGGSALLQHASKLGKALVGMSTVLGEIPLTIKIRSGVQHSTPVAHKLVARMQTEWGIGAVTLHGRSRQQRYKTKADYTYIKQCADVVRETAADAGLDPIPIFGNGDAYDYRTYYENMESSGVDGIMIARGALVKPWIFTEIKERRDWDISSRERLDMVGKLVDYGLEHWGTDTFGLNTTRRFLLEALSFQHRYVPVGLLERLPVQLNERAYPYKGRDELETLLASDQSTDWIKISSMFLGPPPDDWSFQPKHKSNANAGDADAQG